ncbi:MAG: hypothetical protein KC635_22565 [Myxococcales bacterium]|nr:hypothetical protein [Myxococcales bacterium]MCB9735360.1 hypothetical protein [Deltaproteobacteria bacterium]
MPETAASILPLVQVTIAPITDAERAGAMTALAPILDRYGAGEDRVPRTDLASASGIFLRADAHARLPDVRERWRALPAAEFDVGCLDALRPLAVGCREVRAAVSSFDAQLTAAKVPLALATEATAHKQRVMRYVDYQLSGNPALAREIADIRSGTGYLDLESDLRRLAVLVRSQEAVLAQDRFFAPDDAAACTRLADALAAELATDAAAPSDWLTRVQTAVYRCYHLEVMPTAAWLFRKTPSALAYYPSVYRGGPRSRAASGDAPDLADAPLDADIPTEPITA